MYLNFSLSPWIWIWIWLLTLNWVVQIKRKWLYEEGKGSCRVFYGVCSRGANDDSKLSMCVGFVKKSSLSRSRSIVCPSWKTIDGLVGTPWDLHAIKPPFIQRSDHVLTASSSTPIILIIRENRSNQVSRTSPLRTSSRTPPSPKPLRLVVGDDVVISKKRKLKRKC